MRFRFASEGFRHGEIQNMENEPKLARCSRARRKMSRNVSLCHTRRFKHRKRTHGGHTAKLGAATGPRLRPSTLLTTELSAQQTLNQRLVSTVLLVKALGGGWEQPASTQSSRP